MYKSNLVIESGFCWKQVIAFRTSGGLDIEAADELVPVLEDRHIKQKSILGDLEDISVELEKAHALLGFMEGYFMHAKPDANQLLLRYKMYMYLTHTTSDIILGQADKLGKIIDGLM